ncbi:MAG: SDR family oxidoreductase [Pseudolabrys sp.]|nr:SDR family oxidoreductase [Pseudolabrys sp.]MBV9261876.1 SDR family oxidoreductase [Pseudolabrys sp.]
MAKELEGKVAIVTGAGRNIGRAIALDLAAAGTAVAVVVRSNKAEADGVVSAIAKSGGKALAVLADVSEAKSVHAMADAAKAHFGRIDFLVNNAALRDEKSIDAMTYADWRRIMDVTLDGAFHCVKACLPAIRAAGGGSIINIGGMSAYLGSAGRAHVTTAKLGIVGFTRGLAHDLAADKITVNCVVPGAIGTQRAKDAATPAHHLTHGTITGERGKPEDVAAAVRYLCGPGARFVTGQAIHVNGGAYLGA